MATPIIDPGVTNHYERDQASGRPDEEFYTTDFFTDAALDDTDQAAATRSRNETENLADRHPVVGEDLKKRWTDWAKEVHVLPFPEDRKTPTGIPK